MNKNLAIIIIVLVVIAVIVWAIQRGAEEAVETGLQQTIEQTAEQTINRTNTSANDTNDNTTVTLESDEGSFTAGVETAIPETFPDDVFLVEGEVTSATKVAGDEAYTVVIASEASVEVITPQYTTQLESSGWTINNTIDLEDGSTITAAKSNRVLVVSINAVDDGGVNIIISHAETASE